MNNVERGVLEIRDGHYTDTGAPADCGGGDGFYWYEVAADELISELFGPFASREAANEAAATQLLSQRQIEAVLNSLAQMRAIESAVVDGEKR
jgi:hypothetical protein